MRRLRESFEERFWDKVEFMGPPAYEGLGNCWEFTGAIKDTGYGVIQRGRRGEGLVRAHHAAWELFGRGPVPSGMDLCHKCDRRTCVRPDHLFVGTRRDNVNDMMAKGRHHRQRARPQ